MNTSDRILLATFDIVRIQAAQDEKPVINPSETCPVDLERFVLVDPELGRLAVYRRELSEYRVWCYAKKFSDGSGKVNRKAFYDYLHGLGIIASKRTFDDILLRGNHLYWKARKHNIYLTGWGKLSKKLTRWAEKFHPESVTSNRPGMRRVWLDLTGKLQTCHASIYHAWFAVRAGDDGYLDISRAALVDLWGRSVRCLIQWERVAGIKIKERYAESYNINSCMIPPYAYLCVDKNGQEFASWQLPNRFIIPSVNVHQHNGQRRKVRRLVNASVDTSKPAIEKAGGRHRVQRVGRLYFTGKMTKKGYKSAHKQIDEHLRKHQDIFARRHYAYALRRYGKVIYDFSIGDTIRESRVERDRQAEATREFQRRAVEWRLDWVDRRSSSL